MVYCIYQATGGVSAKPSGMCDNPSGCCSIINTFLPDICCNTLGRSGVTTTYLASSDQLLKIQTLTISIQSPSSCEVYAHTHTHVPYTYSQVGYKGVVKEGGATSVVSVVLEEVGREEREVESSPLQESVSHSSEASSTSYSSTKELLTK